MKIASVVGTSPNFIKKGLIQNIVSKLFKKLLSKANFFGKVFKTFLKKGLLWPFTQQGGDRRVWCECIGYFGCGNQNGWICGKGGKEGGIIHAKEAEIADGSRARKRIHRSSERWRGHLKLRKRKTITNLLEEDAIATVSEKEVKKELLERY